MPNYGSLIHNFAKSVGYMCSAPRLVTSLSRDLLEWSTNIRRGLYCTFVIRDSFCDDSVQTALRQGGYMAKRVCQVVRGFLRVQTGVQPLAMSQGKHSPQSNITHSL